MVDLIHHFRRVFTLLKKTQPVSDNTDVAWAGPFFIPRSGLWCPTYFVLYPGSLYSQVSIPPTYYGAVWKVDSQNVEFERGTVTGDYPNDDCFWSWVLEQVDRRLTSALRNPTRYNRFVETHLPLSCRTGKIRRDLTWPKRARRPIPLTQLDDLKTVLEEAKHRSPLTRLTVSDYLQTAAIAYDAGFPQMRSLSPLEKYKRKADRRHGGMLDLPFNDADAFAKWFRSHAWSGAHPWEIVFGHPHGIMLSPHYDEDQGSWNYALWVDSLGWYATAARMAMALAKHKIPFEFLKQQAILDALRGIDDIEVSSDLYAVDYDHLKKERPDALDLIRWDPIRPITLITPDQQPRVLSAEKSEDSRIESAKAQIT